jgi:hypothetical protein
MKKVTCDPADDLPTTSTGLPLHIHPSSTGTVLVPAATHTKDRRHRWRKSRTCYSYGDTDATGIYAICSWPTWKCKLPVHISSRGELKNDFASAKAHLLNRIQNRYQPIRCDES